MFAKRSQDLWVSENFGRGGGGREMRELTIVHRHVGMNATMRRAGCRTLSENEKWRS